MRKILIPLFAILNFILYYLIFSQVEKIFYWLAGLAVLAIIANLFLGPHKIFSQDFLAFLFFNFSLNFAGVFFLLISESQNLKNLLIFFLPFFNLLFWWLLYLFFYQTASYSPFSLNRFFNYISLISFFFISCGVFALNVFLNFSSVIISLAILIIWLLFFWINFKIFKTQTLSKYELFIYILLFFELSLILSWLPISFYLKAFLISLFSYLINLFNNLEISLKTKRINLILILIILIAVLYTARWF